MNVALSRRTGTDVARAAGSALALVGVLVGLPAVLLHVVGLPDHLPTADELRLWVTRPDDGTAFTVAAAAIFWIGWAWFTAAVLVEAVAAVRHRQARQLPGWGGPQRAAAHLIAALAVTLIGAPVIAVGLPPGAPLSVRPAAAAVLADSTGPTSAGPTAGPEAGTVDAARQQATTTPAASRPGWREVPVGHGDTLWSLAERHLGDPLRWPELAKANYGRPQPEGGALTDAHWIYPGWRFVLPAGAAAPTAPDTGQVTAAPQPGRPARLGVEPPAHGEHPQDSSHPAATAQAPAPPAAATEQPPPDRGAPAARGTAAAVPPARATPTTDADSPPPNRSQEIPRHVDVRVRTVAGAGAILAAGILTLLGGKRVRQQRRRRPGQRIRMPEPPMTATELELRNVEDPISVDFADRALRTLAVTLHGQDRSLPAITTARLSPALFELRLAAPGDPPAPWAASPDRTTWTLTADAKILDAAAAADVPAPYPCLITLGHDEHDAHILVDLEQLAALTLIGSLPASRAVLSALAVELATSRWADDLTVTVVGCCPELPDAVGTGRVRHVTAVGEVLDELQSRAADVRRVLTAVGAEDLRQARARQVGDGAWTPEVLLIGTDITDADTARLQQLLTSLPRVSIAAVLNSDSDPAAAGGGGAWQLRLPIADEQTLLEPAGQPIRPQRLTANEYRKVVALLQIANDETGVAGPDWAAELPDDEPDLASLPTHSRSHTDTEQPPSGDPTLQASSRPADDTTDSSTSPSRTANDGAGGTPDRPHGSDVDHPHRAPLVRILGPVTVEAASGRLEPTKRAQLTEIATWMVLNPGRSYQALSEAIWPGSPATTNTRNTALSKLRRWFGRAPDGNEYVPPIVAAGGYRFHPAVRCDWLLFQDLLQHGTGNAPTSTLNEALALVRGQPFGDVNPRRYTWSDSIKQEAISAIVDVAHELARRYLTEGDAANARRTATIGLRADPAAEILWRDLLRAEYLTGNRTSIEHIADRLTSRLEELDCEMEPATIDLLDELLNSNRTPALSSAN